MSHRGGGGNPLTSDDDDSYPPNDDENPVENDSEEITYTYKTYYDYFIDNMDCTGVYDDNGNLTNVTISAEKKAEILSTDFTGSGTSTDPYQVNSSLGFWFMSKFVTLTNCYVELNCDVILNDETFDENGNASGGDGVVYSWEPITNAKQMIFDGKYHNINGLFFNDAEKNSISLFGNTSIYEIKKLNMKNVYVQANYYVSTLCQRAININEVKVLSGVLYGNRYVGGVVAVEVENIQNCVNFANIFNIGVSVTNHYSFGGICVNVKKSCTNCENFGNIYARGWVGGISAYGESSEKIIFSNCKNYGNLTYDEANYCGGIVSKIEAHVVIENCENYGNVNGSDKVGGIIGRLTDNGKILNCKNFGDIISTTSSGYSLGGAIGAINIKTGGYILIDGFENYGTFFRNYAHDTCSAVVGQTWSEEEEKEFILTIRNCHLEVDYEKSVGCLFINYVKENKHLEIKIENNVVIVNKATNYQNVYLTGRMFIKYIEIKNLIINTKENLNETFTICNNEETDDYHIKNVIVNAGNNTIRLRMSTKSILNEILIMGDNQKQYYGSDFSGFYVSWRTGKIGLKALDGVGYFQGAIDEEWLGNNGFVKKG